MSGAWNPTRWSHAPRGSFKPAPGAALAPHLRLVRPVAGAYDLNVWVADQLTLQIEVAVKFAPEDAAVAVPRAPGATPSEAPEDVHRFLRQARCTAKIADPHLVQILEQGRAQGGIPFLVSELLEGMSSSERLLSGPFALSHAQAVLSQVAGVLAKAHPLGLWHGSLCPEHLFLMEAAGAPFVKLANFADVSLETWANDPVSRLSPDAPSRRQAYLSPEQLLHGEGSSAAADLWSLGVLLYELLTTTLPFEAATSAGLSVAICNAQFSPPSHYRADLPPAVDAWFSRVFAKEQGARLLDPAALARQFAQAIGASGEAASSGDAAPNEAAPDDTALELQREYGADEHTVPWDLPSDWALPRASSDSFPPPFPPAQSQPPERPSVLPSSGPPPLPDRAPSSYPPPPFLNAATGISLRAPAPRLPSLTAPSARAALPTLPPPAPRATPTALSLQAESPPPRARGYRFSTGQGLAAGAVVGGAVAFLVWGIQSWPDGNEATSEAETRTAPHATAESDLHTDPLHTAPLRPASQRPASMHPTGSASRSTGARPTDNENLPVILQTDELPRAPEETDEEESSTNGTAGGPAVASTAKPDPRPKGAATVPQPKPPLVTPAATSAPPRRETPQSSAKPVSPSADCNPPYFFDKNNIRRLKLECL